MYLIYNHFLVAVSMFCLTLIISGGGWEGDGRGDGRGDRREIVGGWEGGVESVTNNQNSY